MFFCTGLVLLLGFWDFWGLSGKTQKFFLLLGLFSFRSCFLLGFVSGSHQNSWDRFAFEESFPTMHSRAGLRAFFTLF
jgi:hypothetical protein